MRFEWDDRKAATNLAKHGIAFEVAITAFDDPFALVAPDPAHSTATEQRQWLIGEADAGVLVVIFAVRAPAVSTASPVRGERIERNGSVMSKAKEFPFEAARRAIEQKLGQPRRGRGRPAKGSEKYLAVSIRLNPKALTWAKKEAKRRGVGYQTVINEVLLKACA